MRRSGSSVSAEIVMFILRSYLITRGAVGIDYQGTVLIRPRRTTRARPRERSTVQPSIEILDLGVEVGLDIVLLEGNEHTAIEVAVRSFMDERMQI